jgi:small subunit ribosomal protein S17e
LGASIKVVIMGNVRPTYIKRVAMELVQKYPRATSADFENNKVLVSKLTDVSSIVMRNRIAGYISRYWQNQEF